MAWTPDKIKLLKRLWLKGKSTVEIGKELGMSKNAVVGKVHRLELDARPSPIKKNTSETKTLNKEKTVQKETEKMSLLDLRINSCRWPIGELKDEDFHFCGKECQTGKPYCSEHCKIAYTSLKELTLQNAKNKKERTVPTVTQTENKPTVTQTVETSKSGSDKKSVSSSKTKQRKSTTKSSGKKEK